MTEENQPPPPSGDDKKKPSRNRGRARRRAHKRNQLKKKQQQGSKPAGASNNNKQPQVPQTPQVKVTIRNIQNSAQYGSVKSILQDLLPKLLQKSIDAKGSNNTQYSFDVDTKAVRALIVEEEKVDEYKAAEKARM